MLRGNNSMIKIVPTSALVAELNQALEQSYDVPEIGSAAVIKLLRSRLAEAREQLILLSEYYATPEKEIKRALDAIEAQLNLRGSKIEAFNYAVETFNGDFFRSVKDLPLALRIASFLSSYFPEENVDVWKNPNFDKNTAEEQI